MKTVEQQKQAKNIRKGDKVFVIAGNDRGQTGAVLSRTTDRAVIQGVNVRKKHVKKSEANPQGGIVELERSIHLSNLKVIEEQEKKKPAKEKKASKRPVKKS